MRVRSSRRKWRRNCRQFSSHRPVRGGDAWHGTCSLLPAMKSKRTWIWITLGLGMIFVGCNGLARMEYFCSECATDRVTLQLCLPKNKPVVTFYSLETASQFTTLKRAVEPARCEHRWVFANGKGGSFIRAEGAAARRERLRLLDNQGVVTSAS